MIDSIDAIELLGGSPLGLNQDNKKQAGIRLDYTGTILQKPFGFSRTKIIKSGDMVEIYDAERPFKYGFKGKSRKKSPHKSIRYDEHRARSIIRAINNVRRLIHLNFTENDIFLTLTFNNDQNFNINNLKTCLPFYQKFIRQLHQVYSNLIYITVPEFQKRGAVHYHLIYNLPFITEDELKKFWPYGFFKQKKIMSSMHLAFYLCKYLGKKFDDKRKEGHRLFYSSRNLKRSQTFYGSRMEQISREYKKTHCDTLQYEKKYNSAHNGTVEYRQYTKKK